MTRVVVAKELETRIRAMLDAGVDPNALVSVLSTIMIECAMNIVRRSDQRTGSPIEIKNFQHELIEGQVNILAERCPELFCVKAA
jgi:hypothetical protein